MNHPYHSRGDPSVFSSNHRTDITRCAATRPNTVFRLEASVQNGAATDLIFAMITRRILSRHGASPASFICYHKMACHDLHSLQTQKVMDGRLTPTFLRFSPCEALTVVSPCLSPLVNTRPPLSMLNSINAQPTFTFSNFNTH